MSVSGPYLNPFSTEYSEAITAGVISEHRAPAFLIHGANTATAPTGANVAPGKLEGTEGTIPSGVS